MSPVTDPLQSSIDLTTGGTTPGQTYLALLVLGLLLLAALAVLVRFRYSGLEERAAEHKTHLSQQLHEQEPETDHLIRETLHDHPDHARERIDALLTSDRPESASVSLRSATAAVLDEAADAAETVVGPLPWLVRRLAQETVAAAVFGFLAFSTGLLAQALRSGPGGGPLGLVDVVLSLPVVAEVVTLGGALLVLAYAVLFQSWVATTLLLALATAAALVGSRADLDEQAPALQRGLVGAAKYLGVALLPVTAAYLVLTLVRLPALVGAFLAAPLLTQVLVVVGVVVLGVLSTMLLARVAPEVWEGISAGLSRERVRVAALRSGLPMGAVVFAYLLGVGLGIAWWLALVAAVVVGLVVRGLTRVIVRWSERQRLRDRETAARSVVVQGYVLEDADGTEHYVTQVDGERLAWPADAAPLTVEAADAREQVVVSTLRACQDATSGDGTIPPMTERAYADDLLNRGVTDPDETISRLQQQVREELDVGASMVQRDVLEEEMTASYPREVWERVREQWRERGLLRLRGDHYEVRS